MSYNLVIASLSQIHTCNTLKYFKDPEMFHKGREKPNSINITDNFHTLTVFPTTTIPLLLGRVTINFNVQVLIQR